MIQAEVPIKCFIMYLQNVKPNRYINLINMKYCKNKLIHVFVKFITLDLEE